MKSALYKVDQSLHNMDTWHTQTWSSLLPSMFSCILWMECEVCRKRWRALLDRNWGEARIEASQEQSCWFRHLKSLVSVELWWLGSFRWKDEEQGEESIHLYQRVLQLLWSWSSWRIGNPLERRYPKRGSEWQGWNWEPRMVGLEDGGELVERVHRPGGAILDLEHCAMGLSIA